MTAFKVLSPSRFSLTFKGSYSSAWLYNELGQLIPIPQHAWDRESAGGAVGNYDLTPARARAAAPPAWSIIRRVTAVRNSARRRARTAARR